MIKKLWCYLRRRHNYGITYEQRWTQVKHRCRQDVRSRFTCTTCGHKTHWLGRKAADKILESKEFGYGS